MEILSQFGVKPILLLAQAVNFFILLLILKRFLYKPILKVLQERKQRIEESLKNAEEIEKRLTEIADKESEAILKAAKEGEKIIKDAQVSAQQIIEEGNKKYASIMAQAEQDAKELIQVERAQLGQEVKENLSTVVTLALEKVIGKTVTEKQKKEFIEKEVKNLS